MTGGHFVMGQRRSLGSVLPYVWIASLGRMLANKDHDMRSLQAHLGHKNIQHTVRYTELAPDRFQDFYR
jgi:site-specific recombinase XerD